MTDLRRALTNAIRLLEREAALRRTSIEGGWQEFEEDARLLRTHVDLIKHQRREDLENAAVDVEPMSPLNDLAAMT